MDPIDTTPIKPAYKKFPANFAINHALRIAFTCQRHHSKIINFLSERAEKPAYAMAGVTEIGLYADFFTKPIAFPMFVYRDMAKFKAIAIQELVDFMLDDSIYAPYMTDVVHQKIVRAIAFINSIPTEKKIRLK